MLLSFTQFVNSYGPAALVTQSQDKQGDQYERYRRYSQLVQFLLVLAFSLTSSS